METQRPKRLQRRLPRYAQNHFPTQEIHPKKDNTSRSFIRENRTPLTILHAVRFTGKPLLIALIREGKGQGSASLSYSVSMI